MWTPDPAKIVTAEQKATEAEAALKAAFQTAIQGHVDSAARSRNYGDGNALAGYRDSTVPAWSAEAQAFIAWRDQVWLYSYAEMDKVTSGERGIPTVEGFIAELPSVEWPQ
jgi:hypothetical protein